jgi:DNA-binding transcriptional regulator GbsR (MarR family)
MSDPKKTKQNDSDLFQDDEGVDSTENPNAPAELEFGPGNIEAIRHTCEAIGEIIESWGFKRILGMTWAFLYLCPEPASAKDICKALDISPALVSITAQDLIRWGVIKKISPIGKRRDYYIAEHDVWKMIRKVFQEREHKQMKMVQSKLEEALKAVETETLIRPEFKNRRTCQFQKIRIEDLQAITGVAISLLDSFIGDGKMNISPIFSMLKPYNQLATALNRTRS